MKYRTIGTDPKTRREVSVLSLGTMHFGTATGEAASFAILDRYVAAGGTFIDTANNYAFWTGTQGGESEELLGRWRRSRGVGEQIVIATKLGARPLSPGTSFTDNAEGLSARVIRESPRLTACPAPIVSAPTTIVRSLSSSKSSPWRPTRVCR